MGAVHEFIGEAAEENEKGEENAVMEEDVALGGPGDADKEYSERRPSDESGAAGEIGAREKYERRGAEPG